MSAPVAPPVPVRAAAAVVCLQGALGLAFAGVLVWSAVDRGERVGPALGGAAYFAVIGGGVLAVGIAMLRGFRWARSPALVVQVLLFGVSWYATGPSDRPEYGVPASLICLATGAALLSRQARAWAER